MPGFRIRLFELSQVLVSFFITQRWYFPFSDSFELSFQRCQTLTKRGQFIPLYFVVDMLEEADDKTLKSHLKAIPLFQGFSEVSSGCLDEGNSLGQVALDRISDQSLGILFSGLLSAELANLCKDLLMTSL